MSNFLSDFFVQFFPSVFAVIYGVRDKKKLDGKIGQTHLTNRNGNLDEKLDDKLDDKLDEKLDEKLDGKLDEKSDRKLDWPTGEWPWSIEACFCFADPVAVAPPNLALLFTPRIAAHIFWKQTLLCITFSRSCPVSSEAKKQKKTQQKLDNSLLGTDRNQLMAPISWFQ